METTIMKCLRSVMLNEDNKYEFVKVENDVAKEMVASKKWIYVTREEYKIQSQRAYFQPSEGTIMNRINEKGEIYQEFINSVNYEKKHRKSLQKSSTKKARCKRTGKIIQ